MLAVASGVVVGAAVLVVFGAPNRRPSPAAVATALSDGGLTLTGLTLERAEGGRAQLYVADRATATARSSRCTRVTAATPTSCAVAAVQEVGVTAVTRVDLHERAIAIRTVGDVELRASALGALERQARDDEARVRQRGRDRGG